LTGGSLDNGVFYPLPSRVSDSEGSRNGGRCTGLQRVLEEARLVEKLFTTKFKELTTIRLDLP
jgi:hypothetical protein